MLAHAGELGANAVIGVRYDATEIGPGITEVLCYGTAVFVEPRPDGLTGRRNIQRELIYGRTQQMGEGQAFQRRH